jgi:glyoxylase-like metal-dependent hydrolase (beta-lactamase superfamily II)/rhodanese-related sulfurtransferase
MHVEQLYTKCLSEAAYYIESNGEVAIVDPLRDIDAYIKMAKDNNATIKYIFETHFHADFVSGHLDLARKTGATIVYGPYADASFDFHKAFDGEIFKIGDISLELLHTPGHTMESSCFLLFDEQGKKHSVFTGDTLFVGDVGRPDLAVKSGDITQEDLAALLYDSLRVKLMTLPDDVIVFPAHGAGSSCGKNIGSETSSTIGEQKQSNYALQNISKEQFINEVTDGLLAPPSYFFTDVKMNKNGYDDLDSVIANNYNPLNHTDFTASFTDDVIILDSRSPQDFSKGFIKGSINIGLKGQYAPWVGAILKPESHLLLITDEGFEREALTRLARVGYENVIGFLSGGIDSYEGELETIKNNSPEEASLKIRQGHKHILDVRKPGERSSGYISQSGHIRLQELPNRISELNKEDNIMVYCARGYRSMIACSLLAANGFNNTINVEGGYSSLSKEDVPLTKGETCS